MYPHHSRAAPCITVKLLRKSPPRFNFPCISPNTTQLEKLWSCSLLTTVSPRSSLFISQNFCILYAIMRASTSSNRPDQYGRPSSTVYCHTGIGGAGNYHRQAVLKPPPDPSAIQDQKNRYNPPRSFRSFLSAAISGAGNIRHSADLTSLSPEEDFTVDRARPSRVPVRWFMGIGSRRAGHKPSSSISSADDRQSDSSDGSGNGPAYYRSQPLPYGAADILKWRVGEVLGRKKGR